ncbi:MAG: apolipoprotein N-acyltransferase [Alphaproteobacteria bacterium]|nr:apolipoprotein N-acyltransferase [Alphaproteobacteria bacterium]
MAKQTKARARGKSVQNKTEKTSAQEKKVPALKKMTPKTATAKAVSETKKHKERTARTRNEEKSEKSAKANTLQKNNLRTEKNVTRIFTADFWGENLQKIAHHPKMTALLLGVLLTAALPPFYYTVALFIAFAGAMFLAYRNEKFCTLAAIGYWFGFGYFGAGFYWIGNALLIDVVQTGWLYPIALFLNGAFFGLFVILPFMATKLGRNVVTKSMLLAAVWCLVSEWLRGFLLTGFPWNPVSSMLTFSPAMMHILSLFGTYGVSLILVFLASVPAIWLVKPNKMRFYTAGSFVLCVWLGIWIYGGHVLENRPKIPDGQSLVVRLVQPSIPQTLKWNRETLEENLRTYIDLSKENDNGYVDFTVWGETAYPYDIEYDYNHNRMLTSAVPPYGYLITGFLRREHDGYKHTAYNSFAVVNKKGEPVGWYDKSHLVPFGEFLPFRKYLPDWVKPLASVVAEFGRGEKYKILQVGDYPAFAPLICYEVIFSDEVVKKGLAKPTWAVVLTNDGWYGISAGPYQHLAAAQMRAAEEGISIVRSANSGISAVINPYGEIKALLPLGTRGATDALVKPDEAYQTLFGQYGNKIPLAMSGVLILLALVCRLFARRSE